MIKQLIRFITGKPKKRTKIKVRYNPKARPLRKRNKGVITDSKSTWPEEGKLVQVTRYTHAFKAHLIVEGSHRMWRIHDDGVYTNVLWSDVWEYIPEGVNKPVIKIGTKFTYDTDAQLLLKDIIADIKTLTFPHRSQYRYMVDSITRRYEEYITDEGYRGTGRTYSMIKQAEYCASLGNEVWVVFPTRLMCSNFRSHINNSTIKTTSYNCTDFCKQTMRPIGVSQDAQIFIEPYLFQYLMEKV